MISLILKQMFALNIILVVYFLFQFVPFRDFLVGGQNMHVSKAHLAKEVLAEVPDQVMSYMKRYNIKARPPTHHSQPTSTASSPPYRGGGIPTEPPPPYPPPYQ